MKVCEPEMKGSLNQITIMEGESGQSKCSQFTFKSLCVKVVKRLSILLAGKSVPEDTIGKIEVENSQLLAAFKNSEHLVI